MAWLLLLAAALPHQNPNDTKTFNYDFSYNSQDSKTADYTDQNQVSSVTVGIFAMPIWHVASDLARTAASLHACCMLTF